MQVAVKLEVKEQDSVFYIIRHRLLKLTHEGRAYINQQIDSGAPIGPTAWTLLQVDPESSFNRAHLISRIGSKRGEFSGKTKEFWDTLSHRIDLSLSFAVLKRLVVPA